ncbi:hypothetical protein B296_00032681 [Ensete ventricosum]|uniref:Protein kinase domain-containing protein n=1 Tax=Ensete ventricosum TaxID=4639 RepID=A0A426ZN13_ENSVE|nr:hypothetical protein B296_00032681 [Ensete ventricosum]
MVGASTDEQREKDFLTELGTVGHVRHPNVSALLGCCIDRGLHLVFEFSSRGSVSSNLHGKAPTRTLRRCEFTTNGLEAAARHRGGHRPWASLPAQGVPAKDHPQRHQGLQRPPHCKFPTSGTTHCRLLLLRAHLMPTQHLHVSDLRLRPCEMASFGVDSPRHLADRRHIWVHTCQLLDSSLLTLMHVTEELMVIDRCLAPEYFMHGIVDEKTDVFAFGVFLLEIISGRKPVDGSHRSLLSWVNVGQCSYDDGSLQMLVDPRLGDDYEMEQLKRLSFAASLCIRPTAALRPSMTEMLELMEGGEISQDRWKLLEEAEVEEEFWGFDDLDDEDDDDCNTPTTPSTTGSSQP